jgi:hypothetical protein
MDFLHAFLSHLSLSLSLFLQLSRIPDSSISSLVKRKTKPQKNKNLQTLNPVLFVCLFVLFACKIEDCVIPTKMQGNKKRGELIMHGVFLWGFWVFFNSF